MIPNSAARLVESSPVAIAGEFGISYKDSAHIMTILRDTLYSDKILAVLREYGSNAWDSHRMGGKKDLPIKITLPTAMEPTLAIRDFGPGLSQEDVITVYTQYGASTKRTSDDAVGMLGIGCKSGFAYADSFTVTSFHGGMKRIYVAVLDASEKGLMNQIHEEPCGEETGVLIELAIKPDDIREFEQKARHLFQYFVPRPTINTELPALPDAKATLANGIIYEGEGYYSTWTAVMGCVPYKVNLEQLQGMKDGKGIADFVSRLSGALFFNIGEVQISASREELKYSDSTKTALVNKINILVEEYIKSILDNIEKGGYTPWEKRVKAQVLRRLHLPLSENTEELTSDQVKFPEKDKFPKSFTIFQGSQAQSSGIHVEAGVRLVLRDEFKRSLLGYRLSRADYLVKANEKTLWSSVKIDLDQLLVELKATGIPIIKLSSLEWNPPTRRNGRTINAKHRVSSFQLRPFDLQHGFSSQRSENWEVVQRTPTDDDVYVVIEKFEVNDDSQFYRNIRNDLRFVELFKAPPLPTIYGYKTTMKKPVEEKDLVGRGKSYSKWRDGFMASLLTPAVKEQISEWKWATILSDAAYWPHRDEEKVKGWRKALAKEIGKDHPISDFLDKHDRAKKSVKRDSCELIEEFYKVVQGSFGESEAEIALAALEKKYPLLTVDGKDVSQVLRNTTSAWAQYILAVDHFEGCKHV